MATCSGLEEGGGHEGLILSQARDEDLGAAPGEYRPRKDKIKYMQLVSVVAHGVGSERGTNAGVQWIPGSPLLPVCGDIMVVKWIGL